MLGIFSFRLLVTIISRTSSIQFKKISIQDDFNSRMDFNASCMVREWVVSEWVALAMKSE